MSHSCTINFLLALLVRFSVEDGINNTGQHRNYIKFHENLNQIFGTSTRSTAGNICCANRQWQAKAYVFAMAKLTIENITTVVYYNGTGIIAFDERIKKSYVGLNVTLSTIGSSNHTKRTSTFIKDFARKITYDINGDSCQKNRNSADMQIVCIPGNATTLSKGSFDGEEVTTYQFSDSPPPLEIIYTPTVRQNGSYCEMVMFSYAMFLDDTEVLNVYQVEVVDITPEIKDPSIFVPPKYCN